MSEKKELKKIAGSKVPVINVIISTVVLACLLAASIFGVVVFSASPFDEKDGQANVYKLQSRIYTKAVVAAMPKSIEGDDNGRKIEFFIEVNDNYNPDTDDPVDQYQVYFMKDGKKLVCPGGIYEGSVETMYPLVGFFIAGMNSLKVLKKVITAVLVVVALAMVGLAGYLIYLIYAVNTDRKFDVEYQNKKWAKKAKK